MRRDISKVRGVLASAALGLLAVIFALGSSRAYAGGDTPLEVVRVWAEAVAAKDYERALSVLDEGVFLSFIQGDDISLYEGKAEVAALLHDRDMVGFSIEIVGPPRLVMGTVTWTERHRALTPQGEGSPAYADLVGEALVSEGRIVSIIYTPAEELAVEEGGATPGMPRSGSGGEQTAFLGLSLAGGAAGLAAGLAIRSDRANRRSSLARPPRG